MDKRSRFTPEFKAEVIIEALSGQSSQHKWHLNFSDQYC